MKHYAALFLILALAVPLASSLRMSPGSAHVTFEPFYENEFDVVLTNNRNHAIDVAIDIDGSLAQYFSATEVSLRPRGTALSTVSFTLPEDIPPGANKVYITFTEDFYDPEEGMIATRTATRLRVEVWKPYPGRYAEIELTPNHVAVGENTDVEVRIQSRGDQLVRGDLQLRVLDFERRLIDSEIVSNVEVESDATWRRFVMLNAEEYEPGRYRVQARYDYGSAVAEDEQTLIIGVREVELLNATQDVYLDTGINPFTVDVENLWNEPIENVEATFQLGRSTARTPSVNLARFTQKTLRGHWEVDDALEPGTHNALVTVSYRDGEPVTRSFPVRVHETSPRQPQPEEPTQFITLGIIDVVFLLLVLGIIGFVGVHVYGHGKRNHL